MDQWRTFIKESENKDSKVVAKAIIYNDKNKILALISEDHNDLDIPGGHIHEDEDLVVGLKREIKEETALVVRNPKKLSYVYDNKIHFYKIKTEFENIKLSKEHDNYKLITAKEIDQLSKKFQPAAKEVVELWDS